MAAGGCGLPAVGPFTTGHVHTVVVWTLYDVERHFRQSGRSGVGSATTDGTAVFVTADTFAVVEGGKDTRELDGGIGTILVGGRILASTMLPLVGAVEVDIEFLSATEEVTAGETNLHLWTIATTGASDGVGFKVEVVGLLKYAVQHKVKGVGACTRREQEIG